MPHKGKVVVLENREWEVTTLPKGFGIKLVPSKKGGEKQKDIELYFPEKETQEMWFARLKRVCMNAATHGIEIQSMEIDNALTQDYFKGKKESDKGKGKLEMSVWDFAGQHDYYNNHHYFLSTRTVFMVL